MLPARRSTTRFDGDDLADPQKQLRALNDFSSDIYKRLAALESSPRVYVPDDIYLEVPAGVSVGTDPFPIRIQCPFSVAGAVLLDVQCFDDSAIVTSGPMPVLYGRPMTGGERKDDPAYEILYISGLDVDPTSGFRWRVRVALVGVRNG